MKVTLTDTDIKEIIRGEAIVSKDKSISNESLIDFVKPSSIDMPLGSEVFEIKNTFRPYNTSIAKALESKMISNSLLEGKVYFEKGKHYAIPLMNVHKDKVLDDRIIEFSPKSSVGRTDVRVRTIGDYVPIYDKLPNGFSGDVWNIISPQSFNTYIDFNDLTDKKISMNQARFILENYTHDERPDSKNFLIDSYDKPVITPVSDYSKFMVSLSTNNFDVMGLVAKNTDKPLNIGKEESNKMSDFFEPLEKCKEFLFEKDKFYILTTKEKFVVPSGYSVRVVSTSEDFEELVVDYAGFVDPGFGYPHGNYLVLELRAFQNVPYEDGTPVCWIEVYKNLKAPRKDYNALGSHYKKQNGPNPGKFFKNDLY
jgi:dCTP deaminase